MINQNIEQSAPFNAIKRFGIINKAEGQWLVKFPEILYQYVDIQYLLSSAVSRDKTRLFTQYLSIYE